MGVIPILGTVFPIFVTPTPYIYNLGTGAFTKYVFFHRRARYANMLLLKSRAEVRALASTPKLSWYIYLSKIPKDSNFKAHFRYMSHAYYTV